MTDPMPDDEDQRLTLLLRPAAPPLPDAGFSNAVMTRIARDTRRRRFLLGGAGLAGLAIAAQPAWQLAGLVAERFAAFGGLAGMLAAFLQGPVGVGLGVLALAMPALVQAIEE